MATCIQGPLNKIRKKFNRDEEGLGNNKRPFKGLWCGGTHCKKRERERGGELV